MGEMAGMWLRAPPCYREGGHFPFLRQGLWLSAPVASVRLTCPALSFLSGLARRAEYQMFFQSDSDVRQRNDVYQRAGRVCLYADTDHYTVAVDHAWDIVHHIRLHFA